jgi:hypothetical protein
MAMAVIAFDKASFGGTNQGADNSAKSQRATPLKNQTLSSPPVGRKLPDAA